MRPARWRGARQSGSFFALSIYPISPTHDVICPDAFVALRTHVVFHDSHVTQTNLAVLSKLNHVHGAYDTRDDFLV